jgi:hypothetical protein
MLNNSNEERQQRNSQTQWLIAGAGVLAVILITYLGIFHWYFPNKVQNEGAHQQTSISSSYNAAAISLSTCVTNTARVAQVSQAQKTAVDDILKDAIGGRKYNDGSGNVNQAQLINALMVAEDYPDTSQVSKTLQDAMAVMVGCRKDFSDKQVVVQNNVQSFVTWKTGSWTSRSFGADKFPNENLILNVPGMDRKTGQDALDQMSKPIVDSMTVSALQMGIDNSYQTDPFAPTTSTTPAK